MKVRLILVAWLLASLACARAHGDEGSFTFSKTGDQPVAGALVLRFGNILRFDVPGLKPAECAAPQQFALIVNGLDLNIRGVGCDGERLTFDFSPAHAYADAQPQNSGQIEHAWRLFLGNFWNFARFTKPVSLALRETTDGGPLFYRQVPGSAPAQLWVNLIDPGMFYMILGVILAAMVLMMWLSVGRKANLLRDAGVPPPNGRRTYSLSRCQMGWWFMIILASYGLVTALSGQLASMPASTLALFGLSGATGVAAKAIDDSKNRPLQPSQGFFMDILSDGNGVTLARFQLLVWNLLLGSVFVVATVRDLVMPEFDATILGLLGISSGVYTGFKIPENHEPTEPTGTADTPATPAAAQPAAAAAAPNGAPAP